MKYELGRTRQGRIQDFIKGGGHPPWTKRKVSGRQSVAMA